MSKLGMARALLAEIADNDACDEWVADIIREDILPLLQTKPRGRGKHRDTPSLTPAMAEEILQYRSNYPDLPQHTIAARFNVNSWVVNTVLARAA